MLRGLEACQAERDVIAAGRKVFDLVSPVSVCDRGTGFSKKRRAGCFDRNARQYRAGRVHHYTTDSTEQEHLGRWRRTLLSNGRLRQYDQTKTQGRTHEDKP
jgi:hypothetical protein